MGKTNPLCFQAAVERPFSAVIRRPDNTWEGHDWRVEVVAERIGLDPFDVVVDFRDLEAALDALLIPLQNRLLNDCGIACPTALAQYLFDALAPKISQPARLSSLSLKDGSGKRISLRA